MKRLFISIVLLGTLLLAGCGGPAGNQAEEPGNAGGSSTKTGKDTPESSSSVGEKVSVSGGSFVRLSGRVEEHDEKR